MTSTIVHRHHFTVEEVVALLLPNVERSSGQEIRIDADGYVVIDLVGMIESTAGDNGTQPAHSSEQASEPPPELPASFEAQEPPPERPKGRVEMEAIGLCQNKAFQTFLEAKTETAAIRLLATRCHVEDLQKLDAGKGFAANFRDVAAEFEAWMMT